MSQLQDGGPEQCQVPSVDILFEGLEMAEAVQLETEIALFNREGAEPTRVVFGEGVVPDVPLRRYPRKERVADWRTEGRLGPGPRNRRVNIGAPFVGSRNSGGEYYLFEDDLPEGGEEPKSYEGLSDESMRVARTNLRSRVMDRTYEEREAELRTAKLSVEEAFEAVEGELANNKRAVLQQAEAETEEFAAIEDPTLAPAKSILDSPIYSPESVREFRDFQNRRRAA